MAEQSLGEIISTNRKNKGLTQKALAEQLNVTDKAVSKWERNLARPDIATIPKLAHILEIPVTELLNLPDVESEEKQQEGQGDLSESENDGQTEESLYYATRRCQRRRLLILQGIGAALGLLAVITEDCTFLERLAGFLVMPMACAGLLRFIVRVFQIVRMRFGRKIYDEEGNYYVVPRNGLGAIGSFVAIGLLTSVFPGFAHVEHAAEVIVIMMELTALFLLYTDINIVRTEGKGRANPQITIAFAVSVFVLTAILVVMWFSAPNKATIEMDTAETLEAAEHQLQSVTDFNQISSEYAYVCEKAGNYILEEENAQSEYGNEIVIPGSLKAAYFLTAQDPAKKHYDFGTGTEVANAIIVVGHYNMNLWGDISRDEWIVMVFPNFAIDANGEVYYDEADEYYDNLTADSLEDVYTWLSDEYDEMAIAQLELPQS